MPFAYSPEDRSLRRSRAAGLELHSAFQPILSVSHCRVVGQEALLRATDSVGRALGPAEIFPLLGEEMSEQSVHETCSRLHLSTYRAQGRSGWLFLNACPSAIETRASIVEHFGNWLSESGVAAHDVVIEIIENRALDERRLARAVEGYRELGCLVAIDDFGAGESNFERIWRIRPDLVKIDRQMISDAGQSRVVRRLLPGLVSLLHEAGCLVVLEGIETHDQALIAMESGADFVQGYLFSRPTREHHDASGIRDSFLGLSSELKVAEQSRSTTQRHQYASVTRGVEAVAKRLSSGHELEAVARELLELEGVERVYRLDSSGMQVGPNIEAPNQGPPDPRFSPCADASGASWYRRPYFQRAMHEPGRAQISRPYLSIRNARSCITVSIAFQTTDGSSHVLCADVESETLEPTHKRAPYESSVMLR